MKKLIDIGANLGHESFRDDLDEVLTRAQQHHVGISIVTGASHEGSTRAAELASQYPELYATAGIHPHEAKSFKNATLKHLELLAQQAKHVAVGECGLDFYRNYSPKQDQLNCFEAQLELAAELNKPVFMHQRDAHMEFVRILTRYRDQLQQIVVHCFTGIETELHCYLEMDCHIGITGWICDERRGHHLLDLIPQIPSNRLMLETDCPYLLPRDLDPKPSSRRNEPMHLLHIAKTVAATTGKSLETIAEETTATAQAFFQLNS